MRAELVIKGKSLTGTSDLTLLAPLRFGFIPSLDAMTYKTRTKTLLKVLQGGRVSLHEYAVYRPLSDAVERVAAIHSFRVAVLEPEDKVLLAVTFDGTWESYIRVLWQKVGTLLDIIFCNTEGYVVSHTAGFEAWAGWVRKVQVETHFYYNTHGLTVPDVAYLRGEEDIHVAVPKPETPGLQDLLATEHCVQSAESIAWDASETTTPGSLETLRQGLQSLAVLFRLTDTYLPGTADGDILKRAARDLLEEFLTLLDSPALPPEFAAPMEARFKRQIQWVNSPDDGTPEPPRPVPVLPDVADTSMYPVIQAGILRPYNATTHGCVMLIAVDSGLAALPVLDRLLDLLTTEEKRPADGKLTCNVAVSYEGLRALGLSEAQLALFPQEFREGMDARASMLGDFRANHPRRWTLPELNWPKAAPPGSEPLRVEMSTVHLVVQLRIGAKDNTQFDPTQENHPLFKTIRSIVNREDSPDDMLDGVRLLHVQGLRRLFDDAGKVIEHFGFRDGDGRGSDPVFDAADAGRVYRNQVQLGEFLLCRDSQSDVARPPATPAEIERDAWLRDGSFLVVRKLRQYPERLHNLLVAAVAATTLDRESVLAKMMGRNRKNGTPIVAPGVTDNDFNYARDADGSLCPFHAHIRRANPRPQDPDQIAFGPPLRPGGRQPRLMRRSMAYGPPYQWPAEDAVAPMDEAERGLLFMAYNASLAEQFEVVQRWISGGNSAGGSSRQSDPFCGVPDVGQQRTYRFENDEESQRIDLDAAPDVDEDPQPLVKLEWGLYLFAPSVTALRRLRTTAAACLRPSPTWSASDGQAAIQRLQQIELEQGSEAARVAWKAALEDAEALEKYRSAGIWAAIREQHGGVLRTPYGVIIADRLLVKQVLDDVESYTVAGYDERMLTSIGEIFLGLDERTDGRYEAQSKEVDAAIMMIECRQAFEQTLAFTTEALRSFIGTEKAIAEGRGLSRWELNLDAKEVSDKVLASLCQEWFGLPSEPDPHKNDIIVPGSWRWDWTDDQPPIYPAHFTAPSRYIFQPWPNEQVEAYGRRIGKALTAAMARLIAKFRAAPPTPHTAILAEAILAAFPDPQDADLAARSFCGALMGFLPTVDGNFRLSLNEWLKDGTFWSLRASWAASQESSPFERATTLLTGPLHQAMQLRPSPELIWRRVKVDGAHIGHVALNVGDKIVVSLVSASQQCLAGGDTDVRYVFGGDRSKNPHPTHACPGYQAGMGVLLGLLSGLLMIEESVRPSPVALAFTFEGGTKGVGSSRGSP